MCVWVVGGWGPCMDLCVDEEKDEEVGQPRWLVCADAGDSKWTPTPTPLRILVRQHEEPHLSALISAVITH